MATTSCVRVRAKRRFRIVGHRAVDRPHFDVRGVVRESRALHDGVFRCGAIVLRDRAAQHHGRRLWRGVRVRCDRADRFDSAFSNGD